MSSRADPYRDALEAVESGAEIFVADYLMKGRKRAPIHFDGNEYDSDGLCRLLSDQHVGLCEKVLGTRDDEQAIRLFDRLYHSVYHHLKHNEGMEELELHPFHLLAYLLLPLSTATVTDNPADSEGERIGFELDGEFPCVTPAVAHNVQSLCHHAFASGGQGHADGNWEEEREAICGTSGYNSKFLFAPAKHHP